MDWQGCFGRLNGRPFSNATHVCVVSLSDPSSGGYDFCKPNLIGIYVSLLELLSRQILIASHYVAHRLLLNKRRLISTRKLFRGGCAEFLSVSPKANDGLSAH